MWDKFALKKKKYIKKFESNSHNKLNFLKWLYQQKYIFLQIYGEKNCFVKLDRRRKKKEKSNNYLFVCNIT